MSKQSYAARDWRSRQFRFHTLQLDLNRAQRRALGKKKGSTNTPYHRDESGNLVPGVK